MTNKQKPSKAKIGLSCLFATVCALSFSTAFANDGHRLGGEWCNNEDNTLLAFEKLLKNHRDSPDFKYAEYDIRESADGELVAYHDKKLLRKDIEKLTLKEIRKLKPDIATVNEIYHFANTHRLKKPLVADIKHLKSDKARAELIRLAVTYKEIETWFMGKPADIRVAFDDFHRWAVMFQRNNIPMYIPKMEKTILNDQFAYMHPSELCLNYTTQLEKRIIFLRKSNRKDSFDVTVGKNPQNCLRIGVMDGYDDSGDKKVHMKVFCRDSDIVLCDVSPSMAVGCYS